MKIQLGQICAELTVIGKSETIRGKVYRKFTFRNINREDRRMYILYTIDGYSQSKKFLRLRLGNKIRGVNVYSDNDKFYVDIHSDIKEIKAKPLF